MYRVYIYSHYHWPLKEFGCCQIDVVSGYSGNEIVAIYVGIRTVSGLHLYAKSLLS